MIPSRTKIFALWDTYALPPAKRRHCILVARVAVWFARRLMAESSAQKIDVALLEAAALLHDIDKKVPPRRNEHHPDTAVRLLREGGWEEVANVVRTHSLHAILDQKLSPQTMEQKLLYLADKMVKHTIITVDERFAFWRSEPLSPETLVQLDAAYPRVKALEKEISILLGVDPSEIGRLAKEAGMSTMNMAL